MLRAIPGSLGVALFLVACSDPEALPQAELSGTPPQSTSRSALALADCGGEVVQGEIDTYFARLAAHLAASDEPVPMEFYGESFSVHSPDRSLVFRRADMRAGARALPSVEDWAEISRHGQGALNGAGWRGCFLAHGKVWFEADGRGGFAMTSFNRTMPWDAPTS